MPEKTDIEHVGDKLIKWVTDRQFAILYEATQEIGFGCPPKEFRPTDDPRGCRRLALTCDCLDCWRNYTKIQALLDMGLIEKPEKKIRTVVDWDCHIPTERDL